MGRVSGSFPVISLLVDYPPRIRSIFRCILQSPTYAIFVRIYLSRKDLNLKILIPKRLAPGRTGRSGSRLRPLLGQVLGRLSVEGKCSRHRVGRFACGKQTAEFSTHVRRVQSGMARAPRTRGAPTVVEAYTPERKAEFLLPNAVNARDYLEACEAVRRLGIDPDAIMHRPPKRALQ